MLRITFGPKRDYTIGSWIKLHNVELHDLYSLPNIIRMINPRMRWAEHIPCMGEKRNAYRVLMGNPKEKRPLGRRRHRWKGSIKMPVWQVSPALAVNHLCLVTKLTVADQISFIL
jgi:hypothetical protein